MNDYLSSLFSLDGRVALITGGSSGIGAAMAGALARAGARVVLVARDAGRLAVYAADLTADGCTVAWVSGDLSSRGAVARAAGEAAAPFGEPDILVNCAGVNLRPHLGELTAAEWDLSLEVNLTAPFLLGQRFGPSMAERGWGRIINVTSQQAQRAFGNSGAYGVSKAGLAGLTRSQSEAWAPSGVCVNSLCPGWVATPLTAAVAADPVRTAALAERTMAKRNGVPADFEGAAVFLASQASAYITGQTLYADGGFSASLALRRDRECPDRQRRPGLAMLDGPADLADHRTAIRPDRLRCEVQRQDPVGYQLGMTVRGAVLVLGPRMISARVDLHRDPGSLPPGVDHGDEGSSLVIQPRVEHRSRQAGAEDQAAESRLRDRPDAIGDFGKRFAEIRGPRQPSRL
jgi:NAD(P)-dependent dehydrogenase (short-subunit alcohol dehydrogenase family)